MTKRLSAGVVLAAFAVICTAMDADAARPPTREWRGGEDPYTSMVPLFFRAAAGTTWVTVGGPGCNAADTANSTHGPTQVWCFDKAGGDSTWPSVGSQGSGNWNHWSKFNPPVPPLSKWHVSNLFPGVNGGTFNAYCGCPAAGNPACDDMAFWAHPGGYGDDWNYPLELDMSGQDANTGGTIEFDIKYDSECNYDYTYLEYFNTSTSQWTVVTGANGPAIFNAVSGNLDDAHGGTGRACGDDYFFHSDQKNLGSGVVPYHGNSIWLENVTFPMPSQAGGMRIRWRGFSDGAWSDADGSGTTDGLARIDNVLVTFAASGATVSDNFESGDFGGLVVSNANGADWFPGGLEGSTYDGWHVEFDPKYKNKGNTCDFSNDWMWSAKPAAAAIPANGFSYFLVSPKIRCDGWTGAVLEYSGYLCAIDDLDDYTNTHVRFYNSSTASWSLWNDFDGFITFAGCEFWNMNDTELLTPYLGAEVDSLQLAWEMLDISQPGEFSWGKHGSVTYLIDNVSVGNFDGSASVFTSRNIDILSDTFSLVDPAHTPFLQNAEEGNWNGNGGTRQFTDADSLSVQIDDVDGLTAANVRLYYRVGSGTPPTFGAWANKAMVLSDPNPTSTTDEGTYRGTFGNTTTEDFSLTEGTPDRIWNTGSTVEYYVKVTDNLANNAVFPGAADDVPIPAFFRFQVLPFNRVAHAGSGLNILLVDDYTRAALDFEASNGWNPTGGAGFGTFSSPVFDEPEDMIERALMTLYGGTEDLVAGVYGASPATVPAKPCSRSASLFSAATIAAALGCRSGDSPVTLTDFVWPSAVIVNVVVVMSAPSAM